MCGLAGVFLPPGSPVPRETLGRMTSLIGHRGPDDDGTLWVDTATGSHSLNPALSETPKGNLGFGFRRLSVIDLTSNAAQPMGSPDGSVWLVFNGEIYNYRELRKELAAGGWQFRSQSDTEVILALYHRDGDAFVEKLNGMFALALWDQRQGRLLLARDRMGIKPLYYTTVGEAFIFASEIKSLLCWPGAKRGVDPVALSEHFAFQFPLGSRTLFRGIELVEPGHMLIHTGQRLEKQTFWSYRHRPGPSRPLAERAADLRERLQRAVTRQLRSDVPLGSFLSGGMDTGAMSALARQNMENLHTFTCGFDIGGMDGLEQYFDERPESRMLAELLQTDHHELEVRPAQMIELLPQVMWHLEEPRVGISYQILATTEMVADHVTVVLSGVGGDELFAGYPWRYEKIAGKNEPGEFMIAFYNLWNRLMDDAGRQRLFSAATLRDLGGYTPFEGFRDSVAVEGDGSPIDKALSFEARTFMQSLLIVEDRLSMAHGVETRVPILDNEVIDFALETPSEMKYQDGRSKIVLKEAMRGILPDATLDRRKQGFTPPDATWYRGPSLEYIKGLLLSDQFSSRGYFEPAEVSRILDEHLAETANHRFLIWSLMCFEWMNRLFLDPETPTPPIEAPQHAP